MWSNQSAAANRRPAGQSDGLDNLSAIVAADRAFPAAVAELLSLACFERHAHSCIIPHAAIARRHGVSRCEAVVLAALRHC